MSRREVVDCDRCRKKEAAGAQHVQVFDGRRPDPAGGMENGYAGVDLCPECMGKVLNKFCSAASGLDALRSELLAVVK